MNDEFYIGWEDKAPAGFGKVARRFVTIVLILVPVIGVAFALSQRLIGVAYFEWGNVREASGILRLRPYPHLVITGEGTNAHVAATIVAPFKFGVKHEVICGFERLRVSLRATRIHRDGQLMLEMEPGSVGLSEAAGTLSLPETTNIVSLGWQTLRGEIVDSKCWLGVMNPGVLTTHRACAVRCISGGIPPMLRVRRANAPPLNLFLVSSNDQPVSATVLDFVAEPVEITGEVMRDGELLTLRIEPSKIVRLPADFQISPLSSNKP